MVFGAALALLVLAVERAPALEIVVDNVGSGFSVLSQSWLTTDLAGQWGDDYRYKTTSDAPPGEVEWRPLLPATGDYEVAVWYRSTGASRPNNAHYTVDHAGGSADVFVNQQINGSVWVVLGTYPFDAGGLGRVRLTSQAEPGKTIVADAVRFRPVTATNGSFRAVWADAFHVGYKSTSQIDDMVARAVQGNYNAIIPEILAYQDTTGGGHGAYWNSAIVPQATDDTPGLDPLDYLCQVAHANGVQVHPWLVAFRVSSSWPPSGNAFLAAHPEYIMVPQAAMGGGPATVDSRYTLDPGSPDVQEYLVSIVRELVTNYPIDGINWDYIRYTSTDAGYPADTSYTQSSLARFQQITGFVGTPATNNAAWSDFRRRTISELIRRCRAEIAAIKTNPSQPVIQTADLIGFGSPPSGCTFTSTSAYSLHQNWLEWMQNGWLDAAVPMNYKQELCSGQFDSYRGWVTCHLQFWRNDRYVFNGQGNYFNLMTDSFGQMQYALDAGTGGIVNYSYASNEADSSSCGADTQNDWTWYTQVASNVFTAPVPPPTYPWRDPALAVEGTVWGRVTDASTGEPVDDATVQVGPRPAVKTDGNGYYVVTLLPVTPQQGTASYATNVSKSGLPSASQAETIVRPGDLVRYDFALGAAPATMSLSTTAIDRAVEGGNNLSDDNFTVANVGGGSLNYAISDNAAWLSVSPPNGTGTGELDMITISYDVSGLSLGDYTATVTVTDSQATNDPATVMVDVSITPPPIPGDLDSDGDVDMTDYGLFQACMTGPNLGPPPPGCDGAMLDGDNDVDVDDLNLFLGCMSGPNVAGDPNCLN